MFPFLFAGIDIAIWIDQAKLCCFRGEKLLMAARGLGLVGNAEAAAAMISFDRE